jgi:hypothetical protein
MRSNGKREAMGRHEPRATRSDDWVTPWQAAEKRRGSLNLLMTAKAVSI